MTRNLAIFIIISVILAVIWRNLPTQPRTLGNKPLVAVSFYPYEEVAKAIGRDKITIINLTPVGAEPHDFDPRTADMAKIYQSKVFIYNGAGLENWAEKIKPELEKNGIYTITASEGQDVIKNGNNQDPHLWLDPIVIGSVATKLTNKLVQIDSQNIDFYQNNLKIFISELYNIDSDYKQLSICKEKNIYTSHQALGYLAKRYGFSIKSIQGLSPDNEPSLSQLSGIINSLKKNGAKYILTESLVNPKYANMVSLETNAKLLKIETLEGVLPQQLEAGESYLSLQRYNIATLRTALSCHQ